MIPNRLHPNQSLVAEYHPIASMSVLGQALGSLAVLTAESREATGSVSNPWGRSAGPRDEDGSRSVRLARRLTRAPSGARITRQCVRENRTARRPGGRSCPNREPGRWVTTFDSARRIECSPARSECWLEKLYQSRVAARTVRSLRTRSGNRPPAAESHPRAAARSQRTCPSSRSA